MSHIQGRPGTPGRDIAAAYVKALTSPDFSGIDIELEARVHKVKLDAFASVYDQLLKADPDATLSLTVNSIVESAAPQDVVARGIARGKKMNQIRQIEFNSEGVKAGEKHYRKWPIVLPTEVRSPVAGGLDYKVSLSAEQEIAPFPADAGAFARVKSRVSFALAEGWRADLTVTRTLQGGQLRSALPEVVNQMFKSSDVPITPENMLGVLGIAEGSADRETLGDLYDYEVELERVGVAADREASPETVDGDLAARMGEIFQMINPRYLEEAVFQEEIGHIARYAVQAPPLRNRFAQNLSLKRLLPPVTTLTQSEYRGMYPPVGAFLLDKADGVRAVASARNGRLLILGDALRTYHAPGHGEGASRAAAADIQPTPEGRQRVTADTIVDGELVADAKTGDPVFYAFDVVVVAGKNLATKGYEERVQHLDDAVDVIRDFGARAQAKPVVSLTASEPDALKVQFRDPRLSNRPYETDGRILVLPGKPYRSPRASFKWKPLRDTTVDFLARRAPESARGSPPFADEPGHELHFLFVGASPDTHTSLNLGWVRGYRDLFGEPGESYFPVQFSPSAAPLAYLYQKPAHSTGAGVPETIDGAVVELRLPEEFRLGEAAAGGLPWEFVRVREDRAREIRTQAYFGNDFRVAELNLLNYLAPFEEDQLWDGVRGYFAAEKKAMYRAQTSFNSFVKTNLITDNLARAQWVVDAAVGKGQDLGRYNEANVRRLVGIDIDEAALSELVRRKYTTRRPGGPGRPDGPGRPGVSKTALYVLRADLTADHAETSARVREIEGFPKEGAEGLVINFAVHYLAANVENLRNFAALCESLVRPGGVVIITAMLGDRVHDLLDGVEPGESWDVRAEGDGAIKYSIRRDFGAGELTAAGQKIGVLLPFSGGAYYDEYLVNFAELGDVFRARGFTPTRTGPNHGAVSFGTYFDEFRDRNRGEYARLTADDRQFLSLYGALVLRREAAAK